MEKMITLHIEDKEVTFPFGTSILQVCKTHFSERMNDIIAVRFIGTVRGLNWIPQRDGRVELLSYQDEEARRVYERSARYVLLMAIADVLPGARVRIEHSIGQGIYATIDGYALSGATVREIQARMQAIVDADIPFVRVRWSRDEAMRYFENLEQMDTVRLLSYRNYDYFDVYTCGERSEYFYGEMLPSTGFIRAFGVSLHLPGIVLQLPATDDPAHPAPFCERPKLMRAFAEAARFSRILHCKNAADLNDIISSGGTRDFIRVSEALQEKTIGDIAEQIVRSGARLILIAGPSSSGKTTFSKRLMVQLRIHGEEPVAISLDDYYRNRNEVPLNDKGKPDLECLESLDVALFNEHLVSLLQGEEVEVPEFSFEIARRLDHGKKLRVRKDQPIIIEGIHGINPQLTAQVPSDVKYRIYISALTQLNLDDHNRIRTTDVRLLRRMVRDYQFRGAAVEHTMDMWDEVRDGEEKYIFPFQEQADVMFNSSMLYELAVLKKYAEPMLQSVTEDSRWYTRANRMIKFLNYFLPIDAEDEIPGISILREFIGDLSFHKK